MVEKAKALPNFEFCPGWQVVEFLRDRVKDTVIGVRAKKTGQSRDIFADGVIGADGRYSRVTKASRTDLKRIARQSLTCSGSSCQPRHF